MNSVIEPLFLSEFDQIKDKDERILWTERPKLVPYLFTGTGGAFLMIAFSIAWIVFSLNAKMENGSSPGYFWLFGLISFLQGAYIFGKKLFSYNKTVFAFSNKRIMIRSGIFSSSFKIINYDKIVDMEVKVNMIEKMYKVGSILFFSGQTKTDDGNTHKLYDRWEAIPEPYEIFKKVKEHYR
jgi:membrane protein YdbS with pleckstrin-like domain